MRKVSNENLIVFRQRFFWLKFETAFRLKIHLSSKKSNIVTIRSFFFGTQKTTHCNPLQDFYRVELLHREIPVVITGNGFAAKKLFIPNFQMRLLIMKHSDPRSRPPSASAATLSSRCRESRSELGDAAINFIQTRPPCHHSATVL